MAPLRLAVAALVGTACASMVVPPPVTDEPIIAILSVDIESTQEPCLTFSERQQYVAERAGSGSSSVSCFAAFYPRWLEAAGARTVVLPYTANSSTIDAILDSVNGVLFTGGGLELWFNTTYVQTAQYIFERVKAYNDAGDFFPLHGTCMGMQLLSILAANNESVLSTYAFDAENISLALDFNQAALPTSRLFGPQAPQEIVKLFASSNITENLHHDGVKPDSYYASANLSSFFSLISTNVDREGNPFVSTLEAFDYPITAAQWHAERPQFEHKPNIGINHTADAVLAMQYVSNFFVTDARRSTHKFTDQALFDKYSLYAYAPRVQNNIAWGYQVYVFNGI